MTGAPDRLAAALADRYRLERELGEGGMATVYLAEDLKHNRKVAIKVLKPELAAVLGADRFVQEIATTASLQHPNILPLFDSGTADGFLYYVMPYVEGESLRDRLNREKQLPVQEAVDLTSEVADALDYAHRQGVVHRDIKPENILLHEGRPMVADFGIALAVSAAAGGRMTETGLSLGTPHYMSPEQATAEPDITGRSDIYSLASVLYEMLTGDPPHVGSSAQQIIMRIVTETPRPVADVRRSVPPNVAAAVGKALEKLPADRFESAAAFADALADPHFRAVAGAVPTAGSAGPGTLALSRPVLLLVGAGLLAAGLAAGFLLRHPRPPARDIVRLTLPMQGKVAIGAAVPAPPFAVSPDGRSIVFAGHDSGSSVERLYRRSLDRLDPTPVEGTENAVVPFFSPDGRWIGFATSDHRLRKVPAAGGPPVTLVDSAVGTFSTPSWSDGDTVLYTSRQGGLRQVSGNGGAVAALGDSTTVKLFPSLLPGGRAVLFEACGTECSTHHLVALDLRTHHVTTLVKGAGRGWYLPGGYLVYATDDHTLNAVPFDATSLKITGTAVPLLRNVSGAPSFARFAVSATGTMVYRSQSGGGTESLAFVDRTGYERVVYSGDGHYSVPRLSPDGTRIAVGVLQNSMRWEIWTYDIPSSTMSQLTFDGDNERPSWSPDGTRLVFGTDRNGEWSVWWAPADGSGKGERVAQGGDVNGVMATSWTRDGKWIVFDGIPDTVAVSRSDDENVYAVPTTGRRTMRLAAGTGAADEEGEVSPDGRWIAYTATRSNASRVYVTPFLRPGGRTLISAGEGNEPAWISNSELSYFDVDSDSLTVATLAFEPTPRVLRREALFDWSHYKTGGRSERDYDVTRDGKEFLVVKTSQAGGRLIVTTHWLDELRRQMAAQ